MRTNNSYITRTLLKNERVIYFTRPHRIIFFSAVMYLVLALIIYSGIFFSALNIRLWVGYEFRHFFSFALLILGVISGIRTTIQYFTSEYAITNKRVLVKTGWIRRASLELFLNKVEAINVNQSVLGRLLNFGTLDLIGTGGTRDYYPYVPCPLEFRRRVHQQVDLFLQQEAV